jgi:hypothetical protein
VFHWLEGWNEIIDEAKQESKEMTMTLPQWLYHGVLQQGGVLSDDRPGLFSADRRLGTLDVSGFLMLAGGQGFEYLNCYPDTGMLPYFSSTELSKQD